LVKGGVALNEAHHLAGYCGPAYGGDAGSDAALI
jgi:hypothetical protein